jgi:integrase
VKTPDIYFNNRTEEQIKKDIEKFAKSMKDETIPPKTYATAIACIKKFLMRNDIEFKTLFWNDLKLLKKGAKGARPVTRDKVPSNSELKQLLMHGDVRAKSLFSFIAASGMRVGEACKIMFDDIDMNSDPVKIEIRGNYTKSGYPRTTFITPEAVGILKEWLKERDTYLRIVAAKLINSHIVKSINDPRIFPFETNVAQKLWRGLIINAQYTEKDKISRRYKYHIHCLRKRFRTQLPKAIGGEGVDVTEALMGHEGYLTGAYRRYSTNELAESYKRGMYALNIFETQPDLSDVHSELKEKDGQIKNMQDLIEKMETRMQLMEMKLEQEKLKNHIKVH